MTLRTMRGDRLHIGFFGRRNAGKSSLINTLTGQNVAIVSGTPGTTTDPVYKSMELSPLGPVVCIDTAGIDDSSDNLGKERIKRAGKILQRTDLALLIIEASIGELKFEEELVEKFSEHKIPWIGIINKIDSSDPDPALISWFDKIGKKPVLTSSLNKKGIDLLKKNIIKTAPENWEPPFLRDLFNPGETVLLITPIDLGAPAGRLIMPQVKALRDILDGDAIPVMCKERELITAISKLKEPPALAVTDSQVFPQVSADLSQNIPLTSFSIVSIRQKGDLLSMVEGVKAVEKLKPGDKILIAESCTHHPLEDDIGRVKIPRWLEHYVGGKLSVDIFPGHSYPESLKEYKLVIHCGACTLNRREMLRRQTIPLENNIPMTNYGILISYLKGVFPRALEPFPEMQHIFSENKNNIEDTKIKIKMAENTHL